MSELCPDCMRPKHKGSCRDNALKVEYGEGKSPPLCSVCHRPHWRFQDHALRGPEEESNYLSMQRG